MKIRKNLSADALHGIVRSVLDKIPEVRSNLKNVQISMKDAGMSAYAMFSLKSPSLLSFQEKVLSQEEGRNIKSLYGIKNIPSDTQMRAILDPVLPQSIAPAFKKIFTEVQRGNDLKPFVWTVNNGYLGALDATGFFSSTDISCAHCLVKEVKSVSVKTIKRQIKVEVKEEQKEQEYPSKAKARKAFIESVDKRLAAYLEKEEITTETTYQHQLLGLTLVHPDIKTVIPFCPEPIINADGAKKNDCEINASKRLLEQFRKDHPHLKLTLLGDDLYSRAPFIRLLKEHNINFILTAKGSSHSYLFDYVKSLEELHPTERDGLPLVERYEVKKSVGIKIVKDITHTFRFVNGVPLNDSNEDLLVNFLEYWETTAYVDKDGVSHKKVSFHSSWTSDIELTENNIYDVMRAGRCRWNIENCVFNTLKNQGYNLGHNYGHGKENLSTNFALLMMLAFTVDQVQELCCKLFQEAREKMKTKYGLWERIRGLLFDFKFASWEMLLRKIVSTVQLPCEVGMAGGGTS